MIGEPECEPTRPLRLVATLSDLRSCMANTRTRVGEYVKFGLNAIIVGLEIPTELAFKYHKYYSCNLSRKNTLTNCQWENGISWRKLSWIACSYCLLSTDPSNNRGENIR